jgi:hypothetical protein
MWKWLCLLVLASCALAEDQPAGHESAIVFMQRVLTETKAKGIEALRAHVIYQEGKVVSPDLTTSMSEWIASEQRNGWITKPIAEHGGNDFKMLVMQRGQDIDPLFVVWMKSSSSWKVVWQSSDEDHFIGRENVQRLRQQFDDIEAKFRAERKRQPAP